MPCGNEVCREQPEAGAAEGAGEMWKNALEMPEPEWRDPTAILKPEAEDRMEAAGRRAVRWLGARWAWIALWAVCVAGTVVLNHFENLNRIRPSLGGEAVLAAVPLLVWIVLKADGKDG